MKSTGRRVLMLLLAAALLLSLGAVSASAKTNDYPSVRVYMDGLLAARAYRYGQEIYLSVTDVAAWFAVEAEEHYERATYDIDIEGDSLRLEARIGRPYLTVNGHFLLNTRGIIGSQGRVYFPVAVIEKIFHLEATVAETLDRVDFDASAAELLRGGENYYEQTFGKESVLWLSKIIHAECADQPLVGKVGVGNVVLNRVADERFPDTVFDVVFDTKNGVQFAPVYDGRIYEDAGELDRIAAYLALEGYKTVGDSLYFIAPEYADDSWLRDYHGFVTTIGNHDFYL